MQQHDKQIIKCDSEPLTDKLLTESLQIAPNYVLSEHFANKLVTTHIQHLYWKSYWQQFFITIGISLLLLILAAGLFSFVTPQIWLRINSLNQEYITIIALCIIGIGFTFFLNHIGLRYLLWHHKHSHVHHQEHYGL